MKTISTPVRTHLLHLLLFLVIHVCTKPYALVEQMRDYTPISHNCCTYCAHLRAVREVCIHALIHGTYLQYVMHVSTYQRTYVKNENRDQRRKNWQGSKELLKRSQHPDEGLTGRKSSLNEKRLACLNDGRYGQHACRLLTLIVRNSQKFTKSRSLIRA